ncbi:MAG: FliM/FliN family flagellar motor switch protein [Desulfobacterium sp.]|nr:FliM/FliN family flagellar motor switch protein [Desulfobacterium sp.]
MNSNIAPYAPVKYSHLECRMFNLISSRTVRFNMDIGKEQVSVTLGFAGTSFPYQGLNGGHEAHLAFEAADTLWQVSFQKTRFLYELMEAADTSDFFTETPPESLPENVLWAVLEAFLSKSLARTEASLGYPVKIAAPVNPPAFDCFSARFEISFGAPGDTIKRGHGFFLIPFTDACVDILEGLLSGFPPIPWQQAPLSGLGKTVFFEAGTTVLTAGELDAMEVGDVLIPDSWYPKENRVALRISPDLYFGNYDEQTRAVTVETPPCSAMETPVDNGPITGRKDKLGKENMTEENAMLETEDTDGLKRTGNLELNLVFEVGKTTMTIEEIGQLNQGQVIQLPHKLDNGVPVAIKVNEQLIARGKIVGVGDE